MALKQRLVKDQAKTCLPLPDLFWEESRINPPVWMNAPSPIKGSLGGRQDPVAALRKQNEPHTPSPCLWQLGPWAAPWSFAPKTVDLQLVMYSGEWFEIVQDGSDETQQEQHMLQTVLVGGSCHTSSGQSAPTHVLRPSLLFQLPIHVGGPDNLPRKFSIRSR